MIDPAKFLEEQLAAWPMAAGNFAALANVRVKEVQACRMPMKVQFNPARIVSSGAKVDAASLKARPCFLCEANRPAEQMQIDLAAEGIPGYWLLVNPFPIFPRHFTIPAKEHTPQRIAGRIADMIAIARAMPDYTIFYNGPRCGASAPDHMHFQAGNSDFLPLVQTGHAPYALTIKGSADEIEDKFIRLYAALPIADGDEEPMLNILCTCHYGRVTMTVVPRKKHRPACYGNETPEQMLLSPASVDMGGAFITPLEKDFERLDGPMIENVIDELCLSRAEIRDLRKHLNL